MSTLFNKKGTFNHCGRSKAWNSTHHGRYVFFVIYIYTYTYTYIYKYIYKYMYMYMCVCVCVCVCLFFLLFGAVSCRVPRVVGCRLVGLVGCGVNGAKVAEQIV